MLSLDSLDTERRNINTMNLDELSAVEIIEKINQEDEKIADCVKPAIPEIGKAVEFAVDSIKRGGRLIYIGAGTSGRLGILDASECPPTYGVPFDMVIGIMAGGDKAISELADAPIEVVVGAEAVTGSTRMKAGTAQKMVLNMISTTTMVKIGKVYQNLMVDVATTNEKLRVRALNIVSEATGIDKENSKKLLEESGYDVKVAIVMGLAGVDALKARKTLSDNELNVSATIKKLLKTGK